jgi:hypothetical protein
MNQEDSTARNARYSRNVRAAVAHTVAQGITVPLHRTGGGDGMHLYVAQSACGLVKIGRSTNPNRRVAGMQTGSGQRIKLVVVRKRGGPDEWGIHQALARHRLHGEWFRCTNAFAEDLAALVGPMNLPYGTNETRAAVKVAAERAETAAIVAQAVASIRAPIGPKAKRVKQSLAEYQKISDARRAEFLAKRRPSA